MQLSSDVWLAQARRDVDAATKLHDSGFQEWSVYLSAQAVEKAYKAYHLATGFTPPATSREGHDLAGLGSPFERATELVDMALSHNLTKLSAMAQNVRYPVNDRAGDRIGAEIGKACVEAARRLVEIVADAIGRMVGALRGVSAG